jgi:hypothetical protein
LFREFGPCYLLVLHFQLHLGRPKFLRV